MMMKETSEGTRGGALVLRRLILVLTVAALMAAVMAASAMPAMAKVSQEKPGQNGGGPPPQSGGIFLDNPSSIASHEFGPSKKTCVEHFGKNQGKLTGEGC